MHVMGVLWVCCMCGGYVWMHVCAVCVLCVWVACACMMCVHMCVLYVYVCGVRAFMCVVWVWCIRVRLWGGEEEHDGKWQPDQTEGEDQTKEFEPDPGGNGEPRKGLAQWSATVQCVLGRSLWVL